MGRTVWSGGQASLPHEGGLTNAVADRVTNTQTRPQVSSDAAQHETLGAVRREPRRRRGGAGVSWCDARRLPGI